MDYTQLIFQLLLYILIFYSGLCLIFFLFISKIQTQVYETTIQDKLRPDLLRVLGEKDSNGEIKAFSQLSANELRDLSIRYSNSSNSNSGLDTILIVIGVLLVVIPGYMLYRNGVRFGYKTILWNALGFYTLMVIFGIYFFMRILSRYSPILPSELIQMVITGGQRLTD